MSIAFIDSHESHKALLPLTFTRPVCELRIGILRIKEKWGYHLGNTSGYFTEDYLSGKYAQPGPFDFLIAGNLLPSAALTRSLSSLEPGEAIFSNNI